MNRNLQISKIGQAEKTRQGKGSYLFTIVIALILVQLNFQARGQDPVFHKVSPPERGNFNFVTGITQAPNGKMWFATKNGLYSYNGSSITSFQPNPVNPNSLSSNFLETIYADSSGIIWIGTLGQGLNRFDPESGIFTHFRYDPEEPAGLVNDTVTKIISDAHGSLWIGTHGGLDKFDPDTEQFEHFRFDPDNPTSLSSNQVRSLFIDSKGTLWIGTGSPYPDNGGGPEEGGLNRMESESGKFTRFLHIPGDSTSLLNNKICAIYEDSKGVFRIGTAQNGLHVMDRASGSFRRQVYDPNFPEDIGGPASSEQSPYFEHITFMTEDFFGNFWLGTSTAGIFSFPASGDPGVHYNAGDSSNLSLSINGAWGAFSSRDGVFWLGGIEGNIYRVNLFQKEIPNFQTSSGVNHFYEGSDGDLWIATDQKILKQKEQNSTIQQVEIDITPNSDETDFVQFILEDSQGQVWITGNQGINRWDVQDEKLINYRHEAENRNSLSNNMVFTLYEDSDQTLWAGTLDGLNRLDKENGTFRKFYLNQVDTGFIGLNIVTSILEDKQGSLWAGTWNSGGLYLFNPLNNSSKPFLQGSSIICLQKDSFGTIWAGSLSGLFRYNSEIGAFTRFVDLANQNGFIQVNTILEDDDGYLWISTHDEILRINPQTNEINRLSDAYGIKNIEFNWNSGYKGPNGILYFGHRSGYFTVDPDEVLVDYRPPEVAEITFRIANQLEKYGEPGQESLKPMEDEIRLRYDQNVFSFDYAIVDYNNPNENHLIHFLENYDNSWQQANSEGRAYYFNVLPGKYIFRVKAANSFGFWSERKIKLIVLPPWWRTWWAYGMYAILFGLLVFSFDRFLRRHIKMQEKQRTQQRELAQAKEIEKAYTKLKTTQNQLIQAEKMASLGELTAGIAHEIQNPLNFVNNFSEVNAELITELKDEIKNGEMDESLSIADDIAENEQKIIHHGKRADGIVKSMLQHSRAGGKEKHPTDLNALADEYLRLAYHGLRAKDNSFNADFSTHLDPDIPKVEVVPQDIGRVLLNLINNAFQACAERSRRTSTEQSRSEQDYKPEVKVITNLKSNQIVIQVIDNGAGIPDEIRDKIFQPFFTTKSTGEGTGLGLSLSYDIITKGHGGSLDVRSQPGSGTEMIIRLNK